MRKQLGKVSILMFVLTLLFFVNISHSPLGKTANFSILIFGVVLSLITAIFSYKSVWKTAALSVLGVCFVGFIVIVVLLGQSGL